jgi:hypothetical protein
MSLPLYNSSVSQSSRCYTRLTENYRSHRVLLEVPSRLFYSGSLIERADRQLVDSLTDWEGLPNRFDNRFDANSSMSNRKKTAVESKDPFPLLMYGKLLQCVDALHCTQCIIVIAILLYCTVQYHCMCTTPHPVHTHTRGATAAVSTALVT